MSDESRTNSHSRTAWWLVFALVNAVIALGGLGVMYRSLWNGNKTAITERASEQRDAQIRETQLRDEIENLKKAASQREAEIAARGEELRQREAAIAGRENAATERTESSFQGLLIQQQLTKTLESLKASLPDMTPEVERLAREHAQAAAERQRLLKENAELRRKLNISGQLENP